MKPFLFTLLFLITIGCDKKVDCCTIISLDANISLKNAAGEDLLDPNNPNSYKENEIKTYHLINGEEILEVADNVISQNEDGNYIFTTFVNSEGNDEFPITYIDWNETDRDTLKSEIYRTDNQTRAIKIWYNGELKWDVENGGGPEFTIVK